jgi:hypothetical protein
LKKTMWASLVDGLEVLRLWETPDGPKKPEIAILRMSDAIYEKFHEDPQAFLEKHKVFPFTLRRVDLVHSPQKKILTNKSDPMIGAAFHRNDCSIVITLESVTS